jgi:hypothetical protein
MLTESHSITGNVKANTSPIPGVTVTLYTDGGTEIVSTKTDPSGVYLLTVEKPPQQYMIHFFHEDYLEEIRGLIPNNDNHIFDDVVLVSATISNTLQVDRVGAFVDAQIGLSKEGQKQGVQLFNDVARRNLIRLQKAFVPRDGAGQNLKERIGTALGEMSGVQNPLGAPNARTSLPPLAGAGVMLRP